MASNLYLKIDSSNRLNYATSNAGKFSIALQRPLEGCWRLCQAYIPVSNMNVSSNNNVIYFQENGQSKSATLTPGYYDTATLMAEVAAKMTAASGGYATYTVSQSALPLRLVITSTQQFKFMFGTLTNSAAGILGFLPLDSPELANSHAAQNMSNLAIQRSFNISVNSESKFVDTVGRLCTFLVPVLGNTGSLALYEPTMMFQQLITFTQPVSSLNIKVCDDRENQLEMFADWYIILGKM